MEVVCEEPLQILFTVLPHATDQVSDMYVQVILGLKTPPQYPDRPAEIAMADVKGRA